MAQSNEDGTMGTQGFDGVDPEYRSGPRVVFDSGFSDSQWRLKSCGTLANRYTYLNAQRRRLGLPPLPIGQRP